MLNMSIVVMIVCLAGEGLFLLFAGFPFPSLPAPLYAVGGLWIVECICTAFYKQHPLYAIAVGWLMFGLMVTVLSRNSNIHHSLSGFIYQHGLELLFIAASHFGYFTVLRNSAALTKRHR